MERLLAKQRGFALPFVLILLVLFSVVGLSITGYISSEVKTAKHTEEYLQARYLAEAGVEDAIYRLKRSLQNENATYMITDPVSGQTYPNPDTLDAYAWSSLGFPSYLIPAARDWTPVAVGSNNYGYYKWEYTDTSSTLNTTYYWKTYAELGNIQHEGFSTLTIDDYPDVIYFHRTYIGYGKITLNDGTELIRKVKVGAKVSFEPKKAPDAPVYINITEWEDIN
jgi:type II secretory pathway pseudopilin PulG